ncbi:MAG: hypothetical protein ACFFAU_10950 [Candidatus Hodarchaeota archaeon]
MRNYDGDAFVAFSDISGFKELMKEEERAWSALDRFYQYGYELMLNKTELDGLFVSDCGIVIARDSLELVDRFRSLLSFLKELNEKMLSHNIMLITSIAYGHFKYQRRIDFKRMRKKLLFGNAYLHAVIDNMESKPKIQPGQCRLVKNNLPSRIVELIDNSENDNILGLIRKRGNDNTHYYFYWNLQTPNDIRKFENVYTSSYNLKYSGMLKALKKRNF